MDRGGLCTAADAVAGAVAVAVAVADAVPVAVAGAEVSTGDAKLAKSVR